MALPARYCHVRSTKWKLRGFMPCQRIAGGFKPRHRVATLAAIIPGRTRKLPFVDIGVAIAALRRFDFVDRVQSLGKVAFFAGDSVVPALQRIGRLLVHGNRKGGRFETLHRMARRAFSVILTSVELPLVRVVLVAIQAFLEGDRPVKIPAHVAQFAAHADVLPPQRILGRRMVEALAHRRCGNMLPSGRGVTGLACHLENSTMSIGVAILTSAECQADVLQDLRIACFRLMALLARHAGVLARQRIAGLRMIELAGGLPIIETVTPHAILAQLTLMAVNVAGEAVARETQKCSVQILDLDRRSFGGRDVRGSMALLASDGSVFPLECITCLSVVEFLLRRFPVDHLEILTIVIRVAADAILAARLKIDDGRVESPMGNQSQGDFRMALQTLQTLASHGQAVTRNALSGTVKGLMSTRKRPRGNLGARSFRE